MAHAVEMATDLQQSSGSDMAHSSPAPSNPSTSRARSKPRSRSRPARPRQNSSPARASSPHELPTQAFSPEEHSDGEEEVEEADTLSPFDPRRITPTLHASLVSEILSLRREVENKTKAIDSLELSLDESRIEGETLSANLSHATREARSLKHQIQLLEGGTSSAMTELARERDEAVENITDVRKKLEQVQKRARSREEDAERTQMLWDRDRENWENERRNLERKVHVVEGRLKTVLNEVAAAHEAGNLPSQNGESDGAAKDQIKASDNASVASSGKGQRRGSMASLTSEEGEGEDEDENQADYHNVRYSVMSVAPGPQNGSGLNLAQELDFDEQDEFAASDEDETPESPEALPEERPMSVHSQGSYDVASKARRILGLSMQSTDSATAAAYRALDHNSPAKTQETTVQYQDMGIQYSPPPSPKMSAPTQENAEPVSADTVIESKGEDGEEEETPEMKDTATITIGIEMVSTSCQTIGDLPSPPWTPKIPELESPTQSVEESAESVQMVSASIQTEPMAEMEPAKEERATLSPTDIPAEMDIPMIAIHPPGSEPASPRDSVVLPPQTRNVSVQTNFRSVVEGRSIAIQTEEIRIDTRKLPASLLPSAIQDVPPRYEAQDANIQPYRAPVPPPRSAKREQRPRPGERATKPPSAPKTEPAQAYPGNNDNGPLSDDVGPGIRRPFRSSSLFAGFEQLSDDEGPHGEERDIFTDDELLNRPFAAYKIRRGKLVNAAKSRTSWDDLGLPEIDEHLSDPESRPSEAGRSSSRTTQRSGATAASSRQSGMRRMAMISNGASAHQKTRTRSPSEPSLDSGSAGSSIAPPFPVPIRLSSRNIPLHGSDGPPSPTRSAGRHFSDRGQESLARQPTLRRVRSAAAMSQSDAADRSEMRESPVPSTSPFAADSPRRLPRMPFDDYPAPRERQSVQKQTPHQATASVNWTHERQDSTGGVQPTSVVDAIAQTMVGEWMYKYVRRRKSFGMGDSKDSWEGKNVDEVSANITTSGVRHKRWVWLAPYEGSIMWSNKQPTSGPALLGKTGRKFAIQSVLDVKDENPMPKGPQSSAPFDRSILVLTPKRALKFTALTVERHYVWLTALSFLSHSSIGLHDLASLPPAPQEETTSFAPPQAALQRNPIRDSIRVAKGRPRPAPKSKRSYPGATLPNLPAESLELAADAPHVPRFSNHSRKRSNTAPRPPPIRAIRSFSSQGTMPSSHSGSIAGSSEHHYSAVPPPGLPQGAASGRSSISRTSEASQRTTNTTASNMFDMGTVRMEAFIDRHAQEINRARGGPPTRPRHMHKTSSNWSHGRHDYDAPSIVDSEVSFRSDPFRGF